MRAAALGCASAALIACGGDATTTPAAKGDGSPQAACAGYADLPDVYGLCLSQRVASVRDLDAAMKLCVQTGQWEADCRGAWVLEQERGGRRVDQATLLTACGTNQDCAFRVLDTHATGDVFAQLEACAKYASTFKDDCDRHALFRWLVEAPSAREADRLTHEETGVDPLVLGDALGAAAACKGLGDCMGGSEHVVGACVSALGEYTRSPFKCPRR